MPKHYIVVGSGPTGVATSFELLKLGHKVTMIDSGGVLSGQALTVKEELKRIPYL